MWAQVLITLDKWFGNKVMVAIVLIGIGVYAGIWVPKNFVTKEALAMETLDLKNDSKAMVLLNNLQVLQLRKDLMQQKVEQAEDHLETSPTSVKWKSRLETRKDELHSITDTIKGTQTDIQNLKSGTDYSE